MANFNDQFTSTATPAEPPVGQNGPELGAYTDEELLELWTQIRRECIDPRQVFERQWHRDILYMMDRQWIEYFANGGGWKDKRMASWMPRPVTNQCKIVVNTVRAIFTAVQLGVNVRPNGVKPENVAAASTADQLAPVIHESHNMAARLREFDYWLCVTGNAFLHTFIDYDIKYGVLEDKSEQCTACGAVYKSSEIGAAQNRCPDCGNNAFMDAMDEETGEPIVDRQPIGRPSTVVLSPLEIAFNNTYATFEELPYVVRLRWRTKTYYENHPKLKDMVKELGWSKAPTNQSLSLFKSLAQMNDMGVTAAYMEGIGGSPTEDGVAEYEVWYKPCDKYPEGLVFRVVGDKDAKVLHLEESEATPGPLPYTDADKKPFVPFSHAAYEQVGGRILGAGPIDAIVQKQDQLNQLDAAVLLSVNRMSNPIWLIPKGAEPTKITGMPGLTVQWNAMAFGGTAKPERIEGVGPHPSLFTYRQQLLLDIEEQAGTFDIMKGAKPSGVEAFSALQLLDERSKGRFAPVFEARADAYKNWFKFAIELEREFGPDERTLAVQSPARTWTFQNFKRAKLNGSVSMVVESGSTVPKTTLGMRAAMDHAVQMGMVNMQDPDVNYEGLKLMGLVKLVPTLDINIQSALRKQQAFEDWVHDPQAMQTSMQQAAAEQGAFAASMKTAPPVLPDPATGVAPPMPQPPSILNATPLKWAPWYNAMVHRQEFLKWANGDVVQQLLTEKPGLSALLSQHLIEIEQAMLQQAGLLQAMQPQKPSGKDDMQGGGRAMKNSNQESGKPGVEKAKPE